MKFPQEFVRSIKDKDRKIRNEKRVSEDSEEDDQLPPVRTLKAPLEVINALKSVKTSNSKRISSSDYNQWEKYDAGKMLENNLHNTNLHNSILV